MEYKVPYIGVLLCIAGAIALIKTVLYPPVSWTFAGPAFGLGLIILALSLFADMRGPSPLKDYTYQPQTDHSQPEMEEQ